MDEGGIHALGGAFNSLLDGVNAALWRLLELPLFALLAGLMAVFATAWMAVWTLRRHWTSRGALRWVCGVFFVLAAAVIVDHKIVATLNEVRAIYSQQQLAATTLAQPQTPPAREGAPAKAQHHDATGVPMGPPPAQDAAAQPQPQDPPAPDRTGHLYDAAHAQEQLAAVFGEVQMVAESLHPGIEYVVLRANDPDRHSLVVHAFLAIVDLTREDLAIEITPSLGKKTLTSDFARATHSIVAINGEAGDSPAPGSGFGEWTGPWIARGKSVAFEGESQRPFLGFERSGRAHYYAAHGPARRPTADTWNAIWGRWDILRDGVNLMLSPTARKPRTVMGIDRDGQRLFLLVVPGGKPGYSLGTALSSAASIVQAFGAWNAMACDEGGSSGMYLAKADRIVSHLPGTSERVVYTHFGISAH